MLELIFGLSLMFWGLGWWKGIYYNPNGTVGYVLAAVSLFGGIVVFCRGIFTLTGGAGSF